MIIGILGGGQLGRMLALAGYPLGLRFRFFEPAEEAAVDGLAERLRADYDDYDALARFASGLDAVTYEFENVPIDAVRFLAGRVPHVYPPVAALAVSQDRVLEKEFFGREGIPTPPFEAVDSEAQLHGAVERIGLPAVLKTRRFGYDGKGQALLKTAGEASDAWQRLGGVPLILERFIPFERELSMIAVRGRDGEACCYPLIQNLHRDGMLRRSIAPAPDVPPAAQNQAMRHALATLEALEYVGVLSIEFFLAGELLLANEMAPRVHNSGHWTIEGAATSQFENHLRACLGLALGSAVVNGYVAMVNLIGTVPNLDAAYRLPDTHVHLYGKTPRLGRKLGHITVRADDPDQLQERLDALAAAGIEVE